MGAERLWAKKALVKIAPGRMQRLKLEYSTGQKVDNHCAPKKHGRKEGRLGAALQKDYLDPPPPKWSIPGLNDDFIPRK